MELIKNNNQFIGICINLTYNNLIGKKVDEQVVNTLNGFFKELNVMLKGDNTTLIKTETTDRHYYIINNLYSDYEQISHYNTFVLNLRDYLMAFSDNMELMLDILILANKYGLFELNQDLRLYLFKKIYLGGWFSYVTLDKQDFRKNLDYIWNDLCIIGGIVSEIDLKDIELDFNDALNYWYPSDYEREYFNLFDIIG